MWVCLCKFWNSISFTIHHPAILHYIFWATDSVFKLPWLIQVAGCCKHSNEPLASVKHKELLDQQNECWLSWERPVIWDQKGTISHNISDLIHRGISSHKSYTQIFGTKTEQGMSLHPLYHSSVWFSSFASTPVHVLSSAHCIVFMSEVMETIIYVSW